MIQSKKELDEFHSTEDPWDYENNKEDEKRKEILLSELPTREYNNVLDIGCGQGYITKDLPGKNIVGVDLSQTAIDFAVENICKEHIHFKQCSLFDIDKEFSQKFDLIIITGVLYPQYIGRSSNLVYLLIDKLLADDGILVSVHINDWYKSLFPYLKAKQIFYNYRQYTHNLEIYLK